MARFPVARLVLILSALVLAAPRAGFAAGSTLDQLKAQFNKDKGVLRLVVLVSPTCPQCTGGAEWIEDYILRRYPHVPLKVYAVWYEMYPGDSPKAFPAAQKTLPDPRVTNWWDENKEVGRWFHGVVPTNVKGEIQWDAFYLYGPDAIFASDASGGDADQRPAPLLTWGRTILVDRQRLSDKMAELAGPPTVPAAIIPRPPASAGLQ